MRRFRTLLSVVSLRIEVAVAKIYFSVRNTPGVAAATEAITMASIPTSASAATSATLIITVTSANEFLSVKSQLSDLIE